jgi:hypothetical protein
LDEYVERVRKRAWKAASLLQRQVAKGMWRILMLV